jgi:hypothetical protein
MSSFQAQKIKASWIQVSFTLAAMPLGKHFRTLCSDPSRLQIREHVLWWQLLSDKLSLPNLGAPFAPDFGKEQLVKTYAIRLHYLHRHAILILMRCPLQPKLTQNNSSCNCFHHQHQELLQYHHLIVPWKGLWTYHLAVFKQSKK